MTNKFGGKCTHAACSAYVPTGAGWLLRSGGGYLLRCAMHSGGNVRQGARTLQKSTDRPRGRSIDSCVVIRSDSHPWPMDEE